MHSQSSYSHWDFLYGRRLHYASYQGGNSHCPKGCWKWYIPHRLGNYSSYTSFWWCLPATGDPDSGLHQSSDRSPGRPNCHCRFGRTLLMKRQYKVALKVTYGELAASILRAVKKLALPKLKKLKYSPFISRIIIGYFTISSNSNILCGLFLRSSTSDASLLSSST